MGDSDMPSFMDIDWEKQDQADENALQNVLSQAQSGSGDAGLFDLDRPLDLGDKADDAEDFEDISDGDLPDEEEADGRADENPGLTDDTLNDEDDLFGDNEASTPFDYDDDELLPSHETTQGAPVRGGLTLPSNDPMPDSTDLRALNFPEEHVSARPNSSGGSSDVAQYMRSNWPTYDKDGPIDLGKLFPPRKAHFIPKVPLKPPKPVVGTKVSLDLAPDTEKAFRATGPAKSTKSKWIADAEARGLVPIVEDSSDESASDDEFDYTPLDPSEKIGGFSMTDIEIACAEWESQINARLPTPPPEDDEPLDEWEKEFLGHSSKKRTSSQANDDFTIKPMYALPNFDNFENMTAQTAKRVVIDLNDPYLLVDIQEVAPAPKRQRVGMSGNSRSLGVGSIAAALHARFNISNDEAYDALKENHQSKIRATLGSVSIEHSLPALKLQWPYYLVKMDPAGLRAYHRPTFNVVKMMNQVIQFTKPGLRKKKTVKNLPVAEIFKEAKDLSLADHYASATLLEYSEEHPTVLSNFGMGNRIVNYYRRKDAEDVERPVPDDKVGDVTVLLPEDKSPFANFGMVDPGETVRTIHNGMYRAPIFKHEPKNTDFLVTRSRTMQGNPTFHIRNIDHMFVVGQQFPSVEIPGPHSRKVTNAAKNRMKMIAYRKLRHSERGELRIGEITSHIAGSTDMQNRQKLKEFMVYEKGEKVWRMKPGDPIPDEVAVRAMVKPEDVCVIDAMQVGAQYLEDAGYAAGDEDDEDKESESLEQNLAPWKTSKAFLEASSDKAMLELHGEGDPTGIGSAFSMIKTSMKGGYLETIATGRYASTAARIAQDPKANGGHTYNVKQQQAIYNGAIRRIWDQQKTELSDDIEPAAPDVTMEENTGPSATPAADDDDNFSTFSTNSRQGKVMKITRTIRNEHGQLEDHVEIVKDPKVWHKYEELRRAKEAEEINVFDFKPSGDPARDQAALAKIKAERERLMRNKERRQQREKVKAGGGRGKKAAASLAGPSDALSPASTPMASTEKPTGTTRKCANCGQAGHIKTNKKLCPMLNGTMKQEDMAANHGGFGAIQAPSFS